MFAYIPRTTSTQGTAPFQLLCAPEPPCPFSSDSRRTAIGWYRRAGGSSARRGWGYSGRGKYFPLQSRDFVPVGYILCSGCANPYSVFVGNGSWLDMLNLGNQIRISGKTIPGTDPNTCGYSTGLSFFTILGRGYGVLGMYSFICGDSTATGQRCAFVTPTTTLSRYSRLPQSYLGRHSGKRGWAG